MQFSWRFLPLLVGVVSCGSSGGAANSPGYSVIGDWDVSSSQGRSETTGTLNIHAAGFVLDAGGTHLAFEIDGDTGSLVFKGSSTQAKSNLSAELVANDVQAGIVPFQVGGAWTLENEDGVRCSLVAESSKASSTCDLALSGFHVDGGWSAKRTDSGTSSIFGDLTGTWRYSGNGDSAEISFDGSTLSVTDADGNPALTLTFSETRASGTFGDSEEISAKRQ